MRFQYRKSIFIGLTLVLLMLGGFSFYQYRNHEINLYNGSSSKAVAVDFAIYKEFNINYSKIITYSSYQKDAFKPTPYELIYNLQGTNYLPVLNYLEETPSEEAIINSYVEFSGFITRIIFRNIASSNDLLDDEISTNPIENEDGSYTYFMKKTIPTEEGMTTLFNNYLSEANYSVEYYFFEALVYQNNEIKQDLLENGIVSFNSNDVIETNDLHLAKEYIEDNKLSYYSYYENTIAFIINDYSAYLNTRDINQIDIEELHYELRVYPVGRKTTPDKYDLYKWSVDMVAFYEQASNMNYPILLF